LKFFFHYSKLQAGSSKDDYQTKSHLIRPITRPRPTTACFGQLAVRQKAVMKREKAGSRTVIGLTIIIGNASLYFGTLEEEFQWATFFFRGFLLCGPVRKSGSWRSAAGVDRRKKKKKKKRQFMSVALSSPFGSCGYVTDL
jgi:hypothetical protein